MNRSEVFRHFNLTLHREMAAWLGAHFSGPVRLLDAGCGAGGLGLEVARALPSGSQVTLFDRRMTALDEARALFSAEGVDAEFRMGDLADSAFADASFDAVWCSHVLHGQEAAPEVAREMVRILRPGGRMFVREDSMMSAFDVFDFGLGVPGMSYRLNELRSREFADHTFHELHEPYRRGYRSLLREAGMTDDALKTFLVQIDGPFDEVQREALLILVRDPTEAYPLLEADVEPFRRLFLERGRDDFLARDDISFLRIASIYWATKA